MKVVFRADASVEMGAGHVMRCLTLANALSVEGVQSTFICREHPGHLLETIRNQGHPAIALPTEQGRDTKLAHSGWLGATQIADAEACLPYLKEIRPDWLIVDHYGLDADWENRLRPNYRHLMVIDDLADRLHISNVLLDQTYGREESDYQALVPKGCRLLCGSQYALLRPEFSIFRSTSLKRRKNSKIQRILVAMGGADKDNFTQFVLEALQNTALSNESEILVLMGRAAPHLDDIQQVIKTMPWRTTVQVGVNNVAELMAESDIAIGAAGTTSWERCCLGLPSITLMIAENQREVLDSLQKAKATFPFQPAGSPSSDLTSIISRLINDPIELQRMSMAASQITDGTGVSAITELVLNYTGN